VVKWTALGLLEVATLVLSVIIIYDEVEKMKDLDVFLIPCQVLVNIIQISMSGFLIHVLCRNYKFLKGEMNDVKAYARFSTMITSFWVFGITWNTIALVLSVFNKVNPILYYSILMATILGAVVCMLGSYNVLLKQNKKR